MKARYAFTRLVWPATLLGVLWLVVSIPAFPPAPHHTLFGMVRNQWGDPLNVSDAKVFLLTTNASSVQVGVAALTQPGVNYRMYVPMDSAIRPDRYQDTALFSGQWFQIKVQIGSAVYVPIEMTLITSGIGQPAGTTRLDLTLGVDSDGDGLPDAWEEAIIALLGGDLAGITPDGDADGDGISNRNEYVAGTFAFDPNDGFTLTNLSTQDGTAAFEFFAIRGRNYTIETSTALPAWSPVAFRVVEGGSAGPLQTSYSAGDYRLLRIQVQASGVPESSQFYRARVQ